MQVIVSVTVYSLLEKSIVQVWYQFINSSCLGLSLGSRKASADLVCMVAKTSPSLKVQIKFVSKRSRKLRTERQRQKLQTGPIAYNPVEQKKKEEGTAVHKKKLVVVLYVQTNKER